MHVERLNQLHMHTIILLISLPQAEIPTTPCRSAITPAAVLNEVRRDLLPAYCGMFCVRPSRGIGTGLFHWLELKRRAGEVTGLPDL